MALRAAFWVAAGLIVGFVLGGVPARREARSLRSERDALQAKLDKVGRPNVFQELLPQFATAPEPKPAPALAPEPAAESGLAAPQPTPEHRAESAPQTAPVPAQAPEVEATEPGASSPLAKFDTFAVAQRARSAAARAALIEQAGLDTEQVARVDAALARMNHNLLAHADAIVAMIGSGEKPRTLPLLDAGHKLSGVLYDGQRELQAIVGEAGSTVDDESLAIWTYVDPDPWRPIVEKNLAALTGQRRGAMGAAGANGTGSN